MNDTTVPRARLASRAVLGVGIVLSLLLMATVLPAQAQYDPTKPVNQHGRGITIPPGGGDPPGGTRKVALGVHLPNARDLGAVDAFTDLIGGNAPAYVTLQSSWGNEGNRDFPTEAAAGLAARGITPLIWWTPNEPGAPDAGTYARHKNVSNGNYDSYIHKWARDAKAYGGPILLRFAHEANSDYFPWSIGNFDNTNATFVTMWRHVRGIFDSYGASNVKWVWHVAQKICTGGCNPYGELYPGDAYVDVMGFSAYNWGDARDNWMSMYDAYRRVTSRLSEISTKPIMAGETASNELGGDKAAWIRDGYREVYDKLPLISAIVWTNEDLRSIGHPDWRIDSSGASLAAYTEIASLPKFKGKSILAAHRATMIAEKREAKAVREAKAARAARLAERKELAEAAARESRVRKGAVSDNPEAGETSNATAIKTRRTRDPGGSAPPGTLDPFER